MSRPLPGEVGMLITYLLAQPENDYSESIVKCLRDYQVLLQGGGLDDPSPIFDSIEYLQVEGIIP